MPRFGFSLTPPASGPARGVQNDAARKARAKGFAEGAAAERDRIRSIFAAAPLADAPHRNAALLLALSGSLPVRDAVRALPALAAHFAASAPDGFDRVASPSEALPPELQAVIGRLEAGAKARKRSGKSAPTPSAEAEALPPELRAAQARFIRS